jgi:hypothetical protein
MIFEPLKHTKEFLLKNNAVLISLCVKSSEFALSHLSQDLDLLQIALQTDDTPAHLLAKYQRNWAMSAAASNEKILRLRDKDGATVAHHLALNQPSWVNSQASKDITILKMEDDYGRSVVNNLAKRQPSWAISESASNISILMIQDSFESGMVAHVLAMHQPIWVTTSAAKDEQSVLQLRNDSGETVAHVLAKHQPEWANEKASKKLHILKMTDRRGISVAENLLEHHRCLENSALFHKEILTIRLKSNFGPWYIADKIVDYYGVSDGMDVAHIALKLIEQGAAYRQSRIMNALLCNDIIERATHLIQDCPEPQIALQYAIALYATMYHNIELFRGLPITNKSSESFIAPADIEHSLAIAEQGVMKLFDTYAQLLDATVTIDIFCETAEALILRIKSQKYLNELKANEVNQDIEMIQPARLY